MPKGSPKAFKAGQVWYKKWHYDWASFGEQPAQFTKVTITKRTPKMVFYHMGGDDVYHMGGKVYKAKIHTFKDKEYFATGKGTATQVYSTATMSIV